MRFGKGAAVGLAGGILGLLSVFLPWLVLTASVGPLTLSFGFSGLALSGNLTIQSAQLSSPYPEAAMWAYGILAFSILGLVMGIVGKRSTSIVALLSGVLVTVFAILALVRMPTVTISAPGLSLSVGPGFGIYVGLVGGLLLLTGGLLAWGEAKNVRMPLPVPPPPAQPLPPI